MDKTVKLFLLVILLTMLRKEQEKRVDKKMVHVAFEDFTQKLVQFTIQNIRYRYNK
jgi:hypothetical protein